MSNTKEMSKRQMRREQIRRKEMRGRIFSISIISIGAILLAFLFIYPQFKPVAEVTIIEPEPRPQANANNMGDPDAPVKIIEFSDYQCPFCERFSTDTEPALVETYIATGKVYFTYRSAGNWFSANIGGGQTESEDAAKAAYCAGDQNKYWEMHDMLFANVIGEDVGSFKDRRLNAIAEAAGLDMAEYKDCYSSNKYQDQVDLDFQEGVQAGVSGTPSFLLTYVDSTGEEVSQLLEGAQPFSVFQQAIDAALAASGQ
jgi:protein-disulfide isomerase